MTQAEAIIFLDGTILGASLMFVGTAITIIVFSRMERKKCSRD